VQLELWRPGTRQVDQAATTKRLRAAQSATAGSTQRLSFLAPVAGSYYVEVKAASPGFGAYTLALAKQS
jgi:hypothetical protein